MLPTGPGELTPNLCVSWQIWGKIPKFRGVKAVPFLLPLSQYQSVCLISPCIVGFRSFGCRPGPRHAQKKERLKVGGE